MALQGNLKEFSIAEIFQLIGQQGKSGSLLLVTQEQEGHIIFDSGNVVLARFIKGNEELKLGNMLYQAGVITQLQLEEALAEQAQSSKSVGDILLSSGQITQTTLSEFIGLQTREVIFRILQWTAGAYKFKGESLGYNKSIIQPISTDFLLMDGVRQLDEWKEMFKSIGPLESVFDLTDRGRQLVSDSNATAQDDGDDLDDLDAAFAEFDGGGTDQPKAQKAKPPVDANCLKVLKLVSGKLDITALTARSRLGQFETGRALYELQNQQYIEKVEGLADYGEHSSEMVIGLTAGPRYNAKYLISHAIFLILLGALILAGRPVIINKDAVDSPPYGKQLLSRSAVEKYIEFNLANKIENAVELFQIESSSYPSDLQQLAKKNMLNSTDIENIKNKDVYYNRTLDSYVLLHSPTRKIADRVDN